MVAAPVGKSGHFKSAALGSVAAAGAERAACGHIERARDVALKNDTLSLSCDVGVRNRNSGKEGFGVRVNRVLHQLVGVGSLNDMSEIHNGNAL